MEAVYLNAPVGSRLQLLEDHLRELESSDSENEAVSRPPHETDFASRESLEASQSVLFEHLEEESGPHNHSSVLFGAISDGDSDDGRVLKSISSDPVDSSDIHKAIGDSNDDERLRREVREAAGIDDDDSEEEARNSRSRIASERALQAMDQSAARRRRALELEIPVKKVTSEQFDEMLSFLDDFEDAPATTNGTEAAPLPYSPAAQVMIYSSGDDDSDLEIVDHTPPTSPGSPRHTVRPLAGAPKHLRGAAAIQEANAHLLQLQRKQLQKLHQQQEDRMKDRGLDNKVQAEREWNADLSDLLEQERLRAEKIALLEKSSKTSDSIVDFDDEDSMELANARQQQLAALEDSESEADADADSESDMDMEIPKKKCTIRAKLIDDDESDDEAESDANKEPEVVAEHSPAPTQVILATQSFETQPSPSLTQTARPARHESTQTAPRVDPKILLALHQQQLARRNLHTQFDESEEPLERDMDLQSKEHSLLDVVMDNSPIGEDESDFTDINQELVRLRPASQPESDIDDLDLSGSMLEKRLNKRYNKAQDRELHKQQMAEARRLIDAEAEESEDEDAPFGMRGTDNDEECSSDEDEDGEVIDLIDNSNVDTNGHAIGEKYRLEQLERDNKLMQQIADDVHGGWRRKRADQRGVFGDDLDDHEIRAAEWERRRSHDRRAAMLENKELARMAEDERTRAFVEAATSSLIVKPRIAIAMTKHCSVKESLQFLDETDDRVAALERPDEDEAHAETTLDAKLRAAQIRLSLRKTSSASARQSAYQDRDGVDLIKRRKLGIGQPSLASGPGALNGSTGLRPLSLAAQIPKKLSKNSRPLTTVVQRPARPALQTRNKLGDAIFKRQWV